MNLKRLLRIVLPFLNMGSYFKWLALYTARRNRPFLFFEGKTYTYLEVYKEACRYASLFMAVKEKQIDQGRLKKKDALSVGLYMDNSPAFLFAFFGAALSGTILFCINTGFRGKTLSAVITQSKCGLMLVDTHIAHQIDSIREELNQLRQEDILLVGENLEELLIAADRQLRSACRFDQWQPLIVIYTSGTTGLPKGVPCSHMKLIGSGLITNSRIHLKKTDVGYICMPMFHSNAWFVGIMPLMRAGGSFVLKPRFSASAFESDILENGVTYLNYVGQPIHYILAALEKKYGSPEKVEAALAKHPQNHFRLAHGNGALPIDRKKLKQYLDMEHVYELYGSTEAAISTTNMPGDPIDSLGEVKSKKIVILDENNQVCPYGILDEKGNLTNYEAAVGEICKKINKDNVIFDGYFNNTEADQKKFRDGYFHSGDLGHICLIDGKRYLYFDGRTDDWIRKDGENFSAENVLYYASLLHGVALAAAYGAPCEVADEKVMVALQQKEGVSFDPQAAFDWFVMQQREGGMDPKWMPDFIRIVDSLPMTHQTQKILTRPLKKEHFNIERNPEMEIYFRQRGDTTYHRLTADKFSMIKKAFETTERVNLL